MKKLLMIAVTLSIYSNSASAQKVRGIEFEQNLKWTEIKEKAKAENKYIFVDCYTTWCGPCKQMEREVFPLEDVGNVFNKGFICVEVQMDRTATDDSLTKSRYQRADMFASNYGVNAYPTFLFFDPNGKPVHKVIGAINAHQFIQLAADAKDSTKQYYTLLKNFEPGKLDTGEERALARTFAISDTTFGAKLALDYLKRIPKAQLKFYSSGQLMSMFQNNAQVFNFTLDYILSLKKQRTSSDNLDFLRALGNKPQIQVIAKNMIEQLSEKSMMSQSPAILNFLIQFSTTTNDKGFKFIYCHYAHADSLQKDTDWAQSRLSSIIYDNVCTPQLEMAKQNAMTPNFKIIADTITRRFGAYYAKRIIADAKIEWYSYEVQDKKNNRYWPELIHAELDKEQQYSNASQLPDNDAAYINNTCYDIFLHIDDSQSTNLGVQWMKKVIMNYPDDPFYLDTYASLLYKAGKTDDALTIEKRLMQFCIDNKAKGTMVLTKHTNMIIDKMKNGEQIWLEKDFQ